MTQSIEIGFGLNNPSILKETLVWILYLLEIVFFKKLSVCDSLFYCDYCPARFDSEIATTKHSVNKRIQMSIRFMMEYAKDCQQRILGMQM